jgi:outer membrane protein insertion porin family
MFKLIFQLIFLSILLVFSANSKNYEIITINGNERISNETILVFSEISDDKSLDENSLNYILKKLYNSGFFSDVEVKIENKNLIINVTENPIIQTVHIEGIKKKSLKKNIYDVLTLKDRSSFTAKSLQKDEINILNLLKNQGYYFPDVISSVQKFNNNKIDIFYKINLGNKAKITKISFLGDKKYKDRTLRNIIVSEEYKFWKIISGKKFLNENLINYDKRLLENFYKNNGFYNVIVESSFANYLGNDKFELIYNITSGKKYYFNNLTVKLPDDYDQTNFKTLQLIFDDLKGKNYSINSINKILNEIDKIVLNKQYEFLKSAVTENINDDLIDLIFNIEDSKKFYVEKINIFGNNITQEDVIRNNFSIDEGDAFNELLHKRTLNNLKSLNFFKSVNDQIIDGSSSNQKIINLTIEEKPTGEINAGAGVGTNGGTVMFGVNENNFLGRGIEFGSNVSVSGETIKGLVSLNNPNYKGTNKSLNVTIENSTTDRLDNFGYKSSKTGFNVGSGFEYYDNLYLNVGVSSYLEKLEINNSTATETLKKQDGSYFDTFFNYTFAYDMRDQRYKPTDGYISRFTQNVPIISDSYDLKNTYDLKIYNQLFNENILTWGFYASVANSINGKNVKLSERLFLPANRLRGFESGKVGPRDGSDFIGGNYALAFNANTNLPQLLPSLESMDFSLFFDAANVWGIDYDNKIGDGGKIRSSIGLAVDLFTPIGPLNFSFSEPISIGKYDITEKFRFNLGTTF